MKKGAAYPSFLKIAYDSSSSFFFLFFFWMDYHGFFPSDKPITGVSTYNVTPQKAGLYFNKVQCFCFEVSL